LTLEINRAPLLGRRDAFYDRAKEILEIKDLDLIFKPRDKNDINVIFLLKQAIFNAKFAIAFMKNKPEDYLNFIQHLDILFDESKVGYFALKHCYLIGKEGSFIQKFYGTSADKVKEREESYRQRSIASLDYLTLHIQIADPKYRQLKKHEQDLLNDEDKDRYRKAYISVKNSRYIRPNISTGFVEHT
jgi:hypothetical protein